MAKKEKIVVYPISANPPTWGHADIMMRASKLFDKIYWVAAINVHKKSIYSLEQKVEMMKPYVEYYNLKNVEVDHCSGTVIRYAKEKGASFLLRGLRNTTDFQLELDLAAGNRGIHKNIETICLYSKPHFATISSTLVRELALLDEKIDQYVHPKIVDIVKSSLT